MNDERSMEWEVECGSEYSCLYIYIFLDGFLIFWGGS